MQGGPFLASDAQHTNKLSMMLTLYGKLNQSNQSIKRNLYCTVCHKRDTNTVCHLSRQTDRQTCQHSVNIRKV